MSKTPVYGYCAAGCRREVLSKDRVDVVTQAEYDELDEKGLLKKDCLYLIEDNKTAEEIAAALSVYNEIMNGTKPVPKAERANSANSAFTAGCVVGMIGLSPITVSSLTDKKGVEVTQTGIYSVVYKKVSKGTGATTRYSDIICITDLGNGTVGDIAFGATMRDGNCVISYGHIATEYALTQKGVIGFSTSFNANVIASDADYNYEIEKVYLLAGLA